MTLGEMRTKAAIPALVESMKDENDGVRRTAAQMVGAMRGVGGAADTAVPAVLELLKDKDAAIQKTPSWHCGYWVPRPNQPLPPFGSLSRTRTKRFA